MHGKILTVSDAELIVDSMDKYLYIVDSPYVFSRITTAAIAKGTTVIAEDKNVQGLLKDLGIRVRR